MRYAITGAAGALRDLGVELVPGDLDDRAALDRLCAGAAGLFDVAGWDKPGAARPRRPGQRRGHPQRPRRRARNQVPKVVYTSTLAVNNDTEEQAVDATYRVTGQHRPAYDRTTAEAHDVALAFAGQGRRRRGCFASPTTAQVRVARIAAWSGVRPQR